MSKSLWFAVVLVLSVIPASTPAQFSRVVSDKRNIEIRASEEVTVPAEIAIVKIGFQNQAATKDAAYQENTKASAKIILALLDAKVPKDAIETQTISLERQDEMNGPNAVRTIKFSANQEWRIHVKASEAQKVVDIAVAAGANQVSDVDWSVTDPRALEAKAYAAALNRARALAESTASQAAGQARRNSFDHKFCLALCLLIDPEYRGRLVVHIVGLLGQNHSFDAFSAEYPT